jgi:peptidyl-prolyl cis-trans isomerase C
MQRYWRWFVGFSLVSLFCLAGCGKNDPIIAQIGKVKKIKLSEFKSDFEKNYPMPKDSKPSLADYTKHLDKMIQENLKIQASYRLGLEKDSTVLAKVEPEKQRLMLRRLYEKVILEPAIRETEIRDFYAKTGKEVLIRNILFKLNPPVTQTREDSIKAKSMDVYKKIQKGESFSELARQFSEDEKSAINGGLLGYIQYPRSNDPLINAAFSMKIGEVSKPIKNTAGFNIIRVEEIRPKARDPFEKAHDEIRSLLVRERNADLSKSAKAFEERQRKQSGFVWMDKSLDTLATFFKNSKQFFREELLDTLQKLPGDIRSMILVKWNKGQLTVQDFANRFSKIHSMMGISMRNKETIKSYIDQFAMTDVLTDVALEHRLDDDPKVKAFATNTMEKAMVDELYKNHIYGVIEANPEEVRSYYEAHKDSAYSSQEMVRIQEVMVNDLALAERIKKQTLKRFDLARYPAEYTIRPGMKEKNGIFEPFTRNQYNQISDVAFGLKIGETGGPIKLNNNAYSVFKLIVKIPKEVRPFEKIQKRVERDEIKFHQREKEKAWLAAQQKEMNVQINEKILEKALNVQQTL